jgi:hypothetical protein
MQGGADLAERSCLLAMSISETGSNAADARFNAAVFG